MVIRKKTADPVLLAAHGQDCPRPHRAVLAGHSSAPGGAAEMPACLVSHPQQACGWPHSHLLQVKKLRVTVFSNVKFTLTLFNSVNSVT